VQPAKRTGSGRFYNSGLMAIFKAGGMLQHVFQDKDFLPGGLYVQEHWQLLPLCYGGQ